jgi:hypothetical protein
MNAPAVLDTPTREFLATRRRRGIEDACVAHWRGGRSVAGIMLEIERTYGETREPGWILGLIRERRKLDPTVPKCLYTPADFIHHVITDRLDQRADLSGRWQEEAAIKLALQLESEATDDDNG